MKKYIVILMVFLFISVPAFADFSPVWESGPDSFISGLDFNNLLNGGSKSGPSTAAQFASITGSLESGQIELSLNLNDILESGIPWFWDGWHTAWLLHIPALGLDPAIYNDMVLTFELILSDGTTTRTSGTIISTDPAAGIALLIGLDGLNLSSCLTGTLNMTLALNSSQGGEYETAVPEPGTLLLLGFGIIGAFLARRYFIGYTREERK